VTGAVFGFYADDSRAVDSRAVASSDVPGEGGELVDECVTRESGKCVAEDVPANASYRVCVLAVPEGYRLPEGEDRCVGPYWIEPNTIVYARSVPLELDHDDEDRRPCGPHRGHCRPHHP
jgi:hypothetical protein